LTLNPETILEKDTLKGVGPTTIKKLKDAGLVTLLQVAVVNPLEIVERTAMGMDTAVKVTSLAQKAISGYITAGEYFKQRTTEVKYLTTGSKEFDEILAGGFESGVITELAGPFASGKSQLCYTTSVLVQLPKEQGGLNAKAAFIDTEKTFASRRVAEIAESRGLDVDEVLNNIMVTKAYNVQHLEIIIRGLPTLLQTGDFGLVIVDSLATHFKSDYIGRETLAPRQQKLAAVLKNLLGIAESFNVVVLVTNQAQANPTQWGNPNRPALGHVMAHAGTHRLWLRKTRGAGIRIAKITDSPYLPEREARFKLTEKGVVDVEEREDV